ncbi:hypothetical protein D3C79_837120 [compost metagenome]
MKGIHPRNQLSPCFQRLGVLAQAHPRPLLGYPAQPWVEQCPLFIAKGTGQPRRAGEPQGIEGFQRVSKARVDFLHLRPQPGQALHRLRDQCLNLRVDLHVAEVGAEGDAQTAEVLALAQPWCLPGCPGQPVAGIRAGYAVEHQHCVVDSPGHWPEVRQHGHGAGRPLRHVAESGLDAEGAGKGTGDTD